VTKHLQVGQYVGPSWRDKDRSGNLGQRAILLLDVQKLVRIRLALFDETKHKGEIVALTVTFALPSMGIGGYSHGCYHG